MANFSKMRKLAVASDKVIDYPMPFSLTEDPRQRVVLQVVPAGQHNKALTQASLARRNALGKSATTQAQVNGDLLEDNLDGVVELYPQHVIKGWTNVFNDQGEPEAYSVEEGKKFLGMLRADAPDYLTDLFLFVNSLDNWRAANAEQTAKN